MYCLKTRLYFSGTGEANAKNRANGCFKGCSSVGTLQFKNSNLNGFWKKTLDVSDQGSGRSLTVKVSMHEPLKVFTGKSLRWWEMPPQPNMTEIHSAQELVDSLLAAGDKLVVVDFYSPGCGGCRALHPKDYLSDVLTLCSSILFKNCCYIHAPTLLQCLQICQLAELNPDLVFLKVNYEQHKVMCHALHVHVLPFFRFYRGAEGRMCSFSCTNATIKKFKDAVAKHGTDRCSLGPTKGLSESDLLALESSGQISRNLTEKDGESEDQTIARTVMGFALNKNMGIEEDIPLLIA